MCTNNKLCQKLIFFVKSPTFLVKLENFCTKLKYFPSKPKDFPPKLKDLIQNSREFGQNSRFRKFQKLALPQKVPKNPALYSVWLIIDSKNLSKKLIDAEGNLSKKRLIDTEGNCRLGGQLWKKNLATRRVIRATRRDFWEIKP